MGEPLDNWNADYTQQRMIVNSMRKIVKRNPGLNRKALSLLGFDNAQFEQFNLPKSTSVVSLKAINV